MSIEVRLLQGENAPRGSLPELLDGELSTLFEAAQIASSDSMADTGGQFDHRLQLFLEGYIKTQGVRVDFNTSVTRSIESNLPEDTYDRSLHTRTKLLQLHEQFLRGEISSAWLARELYKMDLIDRQYIENKQTIHVDLPNLGVQSAEFIELNLPDALKPSETVDLPPIFVVPAMAGDLIGVEPLLRELAASGRRVLCAAYPYSLNGSTTQEYVEAIRSAQNSGPDRDFYREVIAHTLSTENDIELWGYSAGCPLIAEMLEKYPDIQEKISNAVLLAPAGSHTQSMVNLATGVAHEGAQLAKVWRRFPQSGLADESNVPKAHAAMRAPIVKHVLSERVCKKTPAWETVSLRRGGNIVIVSGTEDKIAKSGEPDAIATMMDIPQSIVVSVQGGSHLTPLTDATNVIHTVHNLLRKDTGHKYVEIS